jgi:hypothetical protein
LNDVYSLFAEALHQLCHIGSAYENEPVRIGSQSPHNPKSAS